MSDMIERELDRLELPSDEEGVKDCIHRLTSRIFQRQLNYGITLYVLCKIIRYTKSKTNVDVTDVIYDCIWDNIITCPSVNTTRS